MKDVPQLTVAVFDNDAGLFLPFAMRMARDCKRVLYIGDNQESFQTINKSVIGDGYDNLERVEEFWPHKSDCDLACFPDIRQSGLQKELAEQGFPVWGSRDADSIEIQRGKFLKIIKSLDMDVPVYRECLGLKSLRKWLEDNDGEYYIKVSRFRGSHETYHWKGMENEQHTLDWWRVKDGPIADGITFYVFDPIETTLEIGGDTYCVDGQWPDLMLHGLEHKDKGYLGAVTEREDMPEEISHVLDGFGPILKQYGYKNQWSMEVRVTKNKAFFIDPTCRGGLPSSASQYELWENWPEIVWQGAHGVLVQPIPTGMYSAEALLTLKSHKDEWASMQIPAELQRWIKPAACCEVGGRTWFPPDGKDDEEVGWLCAIGHSVKETIETLKEYAGMLPPGVTAHTEALYDILNEAKDAEADNIPFGDGKIPAPQLALED